LQTKLISFYFVSGTFLIVSKYCLCLLVAVIDYTEEDNIAKEHRFSFA